MASLNEVHVVELGQIESQKRAQYSAKPKCCAYSHRCFVNWTCSLLFSVLILGCAGFLIYAYTPYGMYPSAEVLEALKTDADVKVTISADNNFITFDPYSKDLTAPFPVDFTKEVGCGFVFYSGGRVDFRGYSVILHQLAKQSGCFIIVPKITLNFAIFDSEAADRAFLYVKELMPDYKLTWFIGGHSLGGIGASMYASEYNTLNIATEPGLEGIVFWATYPYATLKSPPLNHPIKALSIYGTKDLTKASVYEEKKALFLPGNTTDVVIEGGNHAQFGNYGKQDGDQPADISESQQQGIIIASTSQFFRNNLLTIEQWTAQHKDPLVK